MKITLQQTGSKDDLGELRCCICRRPFHLGPATCWAISEKSNILWGEVCPACLEDGPECIQERLDSKAQWRRVAAQQETEAAEEGISECPTLEEFLVAETFYERPRFETGGEYDQALARGEIE